MIKRELCAHIADAIARAIAGAEAQTSGEIRVHLERRIPRYLRDRPHAAPGSGPDPSI